LGLSRLQVRQVKSLGVIPVLILSGTRNFGAAWASTQAAYTALSSNSVQRIIPGATHGSLLTTEESSKVVVEAVRQVIGSARTHQRHPREKANDT
jgi:hypothetical protein